MRVFKNGAMRSSNDGKIEWFGIYEPLVENSFGRYMMTHQITEDGTKRETINWWGGWDKQISLQSMIRHCHDLQALEAGYLVYKVKTKSGEQTIYTKEPLNEGKPINAEETANAIKFNCNAYILDLLKK